MESGNSHPDGLPEGVTFHDFERAWRVYTLEEVFEWHWPPSWIERESEPLLADLLKIKALVATMQRLSEKPTPGKRVT